MVRISLSVLDPPVLASRQCQWRTATCYHSRSSLSACKTLPCPLPVPVFDARVLLLRRSLGPDCRDVPLDHRCCLVVELMASLLRTEDFNLVVHTKTCQNAFGATDASQNSLPKTSQCRMWLLPGHPATIVASESVGSPVQWQLSPLR